MIIFKENKEKGLTAAFYVTEPESSLKWVTEAVSYSNPEELKKVEPPVKKIEGYDLLSVQRDSGDSFITFTMIYCKVGMYKLTKVMKISAYK